MLLTTDLGRRFDNLVRHRGTQYWRRGRVTSLLASGDFSRFEAHVQGTDLYRVLVRLPQAPGEALELACSCGYVASHQECCKHIWAALLAIEAKYEPALKKGSRLKLSTTDWDDAPPWKASAAQKPAHRARPVQRRSAPHRGAPVEHNWQGLFHSLAALMPPAAADEPAAELPWYVLVPIRASEGLLLHVALMRDSDAEPEPGKPRPYRLYDHTLPRLPLQDRQICLMLAGAGRGGDPALREDSSAYDSYPQRYRRHRYRPQLYRPPTVPPYQWPVPEHIRGALLPLIAATGRMYYAASSSAGPRKLEWDGEVPWELVLVVEPARSSALTLQPRLVRGPETLGVHDHDLLIKGAPSYIVHQGHLRRIDTPGAVPWLLSLADWNVRVPLAQRGALCAELANMRDVPRLLWPPELDLPVRDDLAPIPELVVRTDGNLLQGDGELWASPQFRYDGAAVPPLAGSAYALNPDTGQQILRRPDDEQAHLQRFSALCPLFDGAEEQVSFPAEQLPELVRTLSAQGWTVTADRQAVRAAGRINVQVTSGIDWFDLHGSVDFDGHSVEIGALIQALRSGQRFVQLGDGSRGLLPEDWLAQHGFLLDLGRRSKGGVRFARSQIAVLDALLQELPQATTDEALAEARARLQRFQGIAAAEQPPGFNGALRDYQKEGLAWALFLNEFRWGGCLADDMGLGKTVQVLALLQATRCTGRGRTPALVVVPKSTVGNWLREAARFAPQLRVLDYTGAGRADLRKKLGSADLVITTYGTMRRDVEFLAGRRGYALAVLDEAQAIKNPASQNAKAARTLQASYRLALTGTPVENHLGELWSIFEFLNPGLLGTGESFRRRFARPAGEQDEADLQLLRRLIRPFVLRRTKGQVAPELPERVEQVLECALPAAQRALYTKLRDHVRSTLLQRVQDSGLARSKMHVLEALLRLRQAACHPGLIDPARAGDESAKLDVLLPMLSELIEEGHKALVFSQFTKMLAIVKKRLDGAGIRYEYLDGRSHKRQDKIDRFQEDAGCPLFLISLKAGGTGLNLTAADYVFILDPWWNPAVEAQAIDRTHRIGQDKKVIAYRLIATDTVESHILELQASKRRLVESIVTADNALMRNLTRADLSLLLS